MFLIKRVVSLLRPLVSRFPRIAAIYRGVRDQLDFMEESIATPSGFKFAGNKAMAQGIFEPLETELLRKILIDAEVLINVGANVGYYCCHALSMGKTVIAFEPIQRNLRYLYKNIKSNGWSGVEIYPIALSNSIGILEIYGGNTGASLVKGWAGTPESYVSLVPSSTMDVVLGDRMRGKKIIILVDIEGAEKWMLEGANLMLTNKPKPIWLVEITARDHHHSSEGINPNFISTFQLFFQNGYQAFRVDRHMTPITLEDVYSISNGNIELDTHNFLFRE